MGVETRFYSADGEEEESADKRTLGMKSSDNNTNNTNNSNNNNNSSNSKEQEQEQEKDDANMAIVQSRAQPRAIEDRAKEDALTASPLIRMCMDAGDVLLFDTKVFHFGGGNGSERARNLLCFSFQQESQMVPYSHSEMVSSSNSSSEVEAAAVPVLQQSTVTVDILDCSGSVA